MTSIRTFPRQNRAIQQRGVATLFVAIIILVILTVVVLFSTNVGLFEQKTATNENRGRVVEQAAELAVNMSGEYLKANRGFMIRKATGGWLAADVASGRRWRRCSQAAGFPNIANLSDGSVHPCMAERDATTSTNYPNGGRRAELWFYSADGTDGISSGSTATEVPYRSLLVSGSAANLDVTGVGSNEQFAVTTKVRALLCRFDTSVTPSLCRANPAAGNRVAVTLIADASLPNENANASVKETWASYSSSGAAAAVPFIGAGVFDGAGTVTIVTAPNAGGYGLPGSIWTPHDAQVESTTGGGNFRLKSCYIGDFMSGSSGEHDIVEAKAICPDGGSAPPCHCPSTKDDKTIWLSGHPTGGDRRENIDVLDRDGNACVAPNPCPPDIQFFPGAGPGTASDPTSAVVPLDVAGVLNDDSLFEWIFGVDYVVRDRDPLGITLGTNSTTCSKGGNCFDYAMMNDLGLDAGTHKFNNCTSLDANSSGLYYITGNCIIDGTVGSPTAPVILVVTGDGTVKSTAILYGMLFIHRDNIDAEKNDGPKFTLDLQGGTVFGSIVVEGDISVAGNPVVIYDDTSVNNDPNTFPTSATFARVPGSWLDSSSGF